MNIFEPSTPDETSPIDGQEVETAEEQDLQEDIEQEQEIQEEDESVLEESDEEESPSDDEGQDELIAGKFKSQDDLVNAYKNLEREFHKSRQKPQQQEQAPNNQSQQAPNEVFWNAFQDDPFGTLQYLVQNAVQSETAPIYEQQQTAKLRDNFGNLTKDYQQLNTEDGLVTFANKIQEIADELGNPSIVENPSPRIMKMAALEAFGDSKASMYKKAEERGREKAENARRAKQGLSAPKGTKPKTREKSPEELIADSIVSAGSRGGLFG
jgi:hypothetical protein